jgi:hypothetical protein
MTYSNYYNKKYLVIPGLKILIRIAVRYYQDSIFVTLQALACII